MIPRKLHRIWLGEADIPAEYEAFWDAWVAMHPGWECITHDEDEVVNRRLFDQLKSMSARSDLLRYELLEREGGVYVDTDFEPLRPLDPLLDMGLQFFAGWEDHRRVCTALIGAEQGHPALQALVRGLPKWAMQHRRDTPDIQTGPVFFTNTLVGRCDVTLMPPPVFYPVSYWDRTRLEELRPTLGAAPFALHHWGRSWMPEEQRQRDDAAIRGELRGESRERRVTFLVPRRADHGHRDAVWEWLRERWEANFPEASIVEGHSDPFSRAGSINAAAAAASLTEAPDVYVIVDSDSWCDPAAVRDAIQRVDNYVIPWTPGYKLTEEFTAHLLARPPLRERLTRDRLKRHLDEPEHTHLSGVVVVTRAAFEEVGGFDERFQGWGFEDTAFIYALDEAAEKASNAGSSNPRGRAALIHLWHPPAEDQGNPPEASVALFNEYRARRGLRPWRRGVDR